MLDLTKVSRQVLSMSQSLVDMRQDWQQKLQLLDKLWVQSDWADLRLRVEESRTSMLTAIPTGELTAIVPSPLVPATFSVVATDGSQILPDQHGSALCYLINIGRVALHYGTGERAFLDSLPTLYFREEDLYVMVNGRRVLVQGELLAAKRSEQEAVHLEHLFQEAAVRQHPVVALEDGSLIKWTLEQGADWQVRLLRRYLTMLDKAKALQVPVCGYLSGSRACDVVNTLRLLLCPQNPVDCDKCPFKGQETPCQQLEGLTDTLLFKGLLKAPGQRSQVFLSSSKVLQSYREHKIGFCYLNVGSEIARLEMPEWVWRNPQLLELTHALIRDQAYKGKGYPVVLSEAHEKAVVKGPDREAFLSMLESTMVKHGASVAASLKSVRKRVCYI